MPTASSRSRRWPSACRRASRSSTGSGRCGGAASRSRRPCSSRSHRHEFVCQQLLRDHDDGRRRADGHQDLQLAPDDVGGPHPGQDAHALLDLIGMNSYANSFFAITTMAVGVPTGIKIFNWLGTMWGGRIQFKTPMLFSIGFLFQFLIAGLTGIIQSSAPVDWQLSLSYFVVAHFHYVIVGGILFALFAAFYYWYPKFTGRMLSESLGKLHFWLFIIGFHMTFDVMHIPGILGMPRRIYTYEPRPGWETLNFIVTIGAFIQAVAILVFVWNLVVSYWKGTRAGNDPWDAWTLEWTISSPPPAYNFATIPVVASRRPLWDLKHPEDPDSRYE